ncbi:MAG TPA: 2-oxo acid dehydrogenase subunit E2 [Kofleriaceae bacterium]|nr:2-oxo acid dehydrogenase subunit E2 [Kofleriaceae bacterium]
MAQIIGLPKLSPTMEEGVLVKWVKKEGERVSPGDLVAEVETDKANMDFNLEDEGVLLKLLVNEGDTVKLGAPVAILGEEGEDIAGLVVQAQSGGAAPAARPEAKTEAKAEARTEAKPEAKSEKKPAPAAKPAAKKEAARQGADPESSDKDGPKDEGDEGEPPARTARAPQAAPRAREARPKNGGGKAQSAAARPGRLLASPLAKSLAIELGVDLRQVTGTGPGGRIVERDVRSAAEGGGEGAHEEAAAGAAEEGESHALEVEGDDGGEGEARSESGRTALAVVRPGPVARNDLTDEYEDRALTPTRRTIAQRLTQAKREMPHFRVTATIDAAPLMDFRQRLNHLIGDRGKISVNDLLLKGAALALRRVPECNAAFMGEAIRYYSRVHMGVAVALEQGLLTPVVRNADLKGIGVISAEVRDLVDRAKRRQIKAHEIQGATFTVSNLGMFGIDHFDAILNPPAACILAVGRIQKLPVVEGERISIGERLSLTMSCDHRAVDGALGARYLDELREILERPEALAL